MLIVKKIEIKDYLRWAFYKSIGLGFVKEDSDVSAFIEKMKALSSEDSPKIHRYE
jgi:hypothetical protein